MGSPELRHPDSQRPITGSFWITKYGNDYFKESSNSTNNAIETILHEIMHVLAFYQFDKFQNENISYEEDEQLWIWKGVKVRTVGSQYYNCQMGNFKGIPLQTDKNGNVGAHWSEAHLGNEIMSPMSDSNSLRISVFTLALLEDSKWYKVDYKKAENFVFKKNTGCSLVVKCPAHPICKSGSNNFVTSNYRAIGNC